MKIKIIKRAAEKILEDISVVEDNQSTKADSRQAAETVKSWIVDLRQKRERERISFHELFRKEQCT
ncbi:MAG TPA: hypothetical protein VIL74_19335 [Pyrinomonadaceae bacterium]|jgi:hypothetical protein